MWMVGYNEGGEFNMARKLRPLVPRPTTSIHATTDHHLFPLNHHLSSYNSAAAAIVGEQAVKQQRELNVVSSTRWNPTPEQLRTLEDLYRRGTRTPSADKIQNITAQLRRYGKIEGKNVFYWFQNHKARERQKRRRQLESNKPSHSDDHHHHQACDTEVSSSRPRTVFEVEQTKNWAPPTNCSTLAEESISMERRAAVAECRTDHHHHHHDVHNDHDGWMELEQREGSKIQQQMSINEKNARWQMMQLCCPPPAAATCSSTTITIRRRRMDPNHLNETTPQYLNNIFTSPPSSYMDHHHHHHHLSHDGSKASSFGESQTLQLFPLESTTTHNQNLTVNNNDDDKDDTEAAAAATNYQFFEFLPLKK